MWTLLSQHFLKPLHTFWEILSRKIKCSRYLSHQTPLVKSCWCSLRISNVTNHPSLALLYCQSIGRVWKSVKSVTLQLMKSFVQYLKSAEQAEGLSRVNAKLRNHLNVRLILSTLKIKKPCGNKESWLSYCPTESNFYFKIMKYGTIVYHSLP